MQDDLAMSWHEKEQWIDPQHAGDMIDEGVVRCEYDAASDNGEGDAAVSEQIFDFSLNTMQGDRRTRAPLPSD